MKTKPLTKSKLMGGFQCKKLLYFNVHRPQWARANNIKEKLLFDQGHLVGAEARKRFPEGKLMQAPAWEYEQAAAETKDAMSEQTTLFEAAFQNGPLFVRVDILEKVPEGWNIIEVKSSVSVKEENLRDCAIQYTILKGLGLPVHKVKLMYVNKECIAPHLESLFQTKDVTEEVRAKTSAVKASVIEFLEMLKQPRPPDILAGSHCNLPYECRFQEKCWSEMLIPNVSVVDLPGLKAEERWALFHKGETLETLPTEKLSWLAQRALESHRSGKPFINRAEIAIEINKWKRPFWFLDFETMGYAVPRFPGTRPYDQIPFQFSLHVQDEVLGGLRHEEFLDLTGEDPRERIAQHLLSSIGPDGDIIAYHAPFEIGVIEDLAGALPLLRDQLKALLPRFRDPLPVLRQHVYFKEFCGKFSIKYVGPALLGEAFSYENLRIQDGAMAQAAFLKYLEKPDEELRNALREYCTQDTLVLVKLMDKLFEFASATDVQQKLF